MDPRRGHHPGATKRQGHLRSRSSPDQSDPPQPPEGWQRATRAHRTVLARRGRKGGINGVSCQMAQADPLRRGEAAPLELPIGSSPGLILRPNEGKDETPRLPLRRTETRELTQKSNQQPGRTPLCAGARGLASPNETQRRGCRAGIKAKHVRQKAEERVYDSLSDPGATPGGCARAPPPRH